MSVELTLVIDNYYCEDCFRRDGVEVRALVRMIPLGVVMNDELVGDEYWCCPHCHRPKFSIKKPRRAVKLTSKRD